MVAAIPARIDAGKQSGHFTSGPAIVLYLAFAKLLLHLLTAARYGIFRDEMYYVACSKHLAWGYVDHPPMNVFITWFARHEFRFCRPCAPPLLLTYSFKQIIVILCGASFSRRGALILVLC